MNVTNNKELQLAIVELKRKEALQKTALVDQFHHTTDTLKPVNLLKSAFSSLTGTTISETEDISDATIGIAIGSLFEKIALGKDPGPARTTIVSLLSMVVTNIAVKNAPKIKTTGSKLYKQAVSFLENKFNTAH